MECIFVNIMSFEYSWHMHKYLFCKDQTLDSIKIGSELSYGNIFQPKFFRQIQNFSVVTLWFMLRHRKCGMQQTLILCVLLVQVCVWSYTFVLST